MEKSGDIEFVRQVIGHTTIVSTVSYTDKMTEEERKINL